MTAKQHRYRLVNGHMEWTGATLKEAQANRDADLNRLFADYHGNVPTIIFAPEGRLGVVFQEHDGYYGYRLYWGPPPAVYCGWGTVCSGGWSRQEAERRARRHLAQACFRINGPDGLEVIAPDDTEGLAEHKRWVRWQYSYEKHRASGMSEQEAHRAASEY